jgi:hypothetical protein
MGGAEGGKLDELAIFENSQENSLGKQVNDCFPCFKRTSNDQSGYNLQLH